MGEEKIQLTNEKLIGNGSFGVVFQVRRVPAARPGARAAKARRSGWRVGAAPRRARERG